MENRLDTSINYMKSIGIRILRPTPSYTFKWEDLTFYTHIPTKQIILFHEPSYMEVGITEEQFNNITDGK